MDNSPRSFSIVRYEDTLSGAYQCDCGPIGGPNTAPIRETDGRTDTIERYFPGRRKNRISSTTGAGSIPQEIQYLDQVEARFLIRCK